MNSLTEKVLDETKRIGACLIPFVFVTKYGRSIMEKDNPGWVGKAKFGKKNLFYAAMGAVSGYAWLFYGMFSFNYGSLNVTKWSEIIKEREQQIIYQQNQEIKSSFYKTAGKDSLIDYGEFERFYKENFYTK